MTHYKKESHTRSLLKAISWRIIATADTIAIVLLITCLTGYCSLENALKIGFLEFAIKLLVYYGHERVWQEISLQKRINHKQTLYKTFSWRIIATSLTFIITGTVLNSFHTVALSIALTELLSKFILYYMHERLWLRLPLGKVRQWFRRKNS